MITWYVVCVSRDKDSMHSYRASISAYAKIAYREWINVRCVGLMLSLFAESGLEKKTFEWGIVKTAYRVFTCYTMVDKLLAKSRMGYLR